MGDLKGYGTRILRDSHIMSLGTADDAGVWVAELVFVYDDAFNLYWISQPGSRHSQAIQSNPHVACAITASWETDNERSLQIEGTATALAGMQDELDNKLDSKVGKGASDSAGVMIKQGYVWYRLTPSRIELIHSQPFGYERQRIR